MRKTCLAAIFVLAGAGTAQAGAQPAGSSSTAQAAAPAVAPKPTTAPAAAKTAARPVVAQNQAARPVAAQNQAAAPAQTPPAGSPSPTAAPAQAPQAAPQADSAAPAQTAPAPASETAAPAQPSPKPELQLGKGLSLGNGIQITGKAYTDISYRNNVDNGMNATLPDSGTGFDLKRFYVGINDQLNHVFSAHFLTDVGDHGVSGSPNKRFDVFVKHAYLEAKFSPQFVLRAGAADNPWIPYAEHRYGFRFVENTLIDRSHFGNSADWGLHALGKFAGGKLGYQVSLVNGRGYSDITRADVPSIEARLDSQPIPHLYVAVGGSVSKLGANMAGTNVPNTGTRFDALAAWKTAMFRVGVEGFLAHDYTKNEITGTAPEDTARGVSAFANYRFLPKVGVFGRFDFMQPNADTDTSVKDTYLNAGVEAQPYKFLQLAVAYKREVVDSGMSGTMLGAVGSTVPNKTGTYQEVGLFSQLVF